MTAPTATGLKLLFAGGGTGGHLYSGIAVAAEARRLAPHAEVLFVGTRRGIEARVLPREGYRLELLEIAGIKGRGVLRGLAGLAKVPRALWQSSRLLRRERPHAVIGIGGYASGPTVLTAALRGIPTAIVEQNVVPGFTNGLLARVVRRIFVPLDEAAAAFGARRKVRVTGCPIRRAVVDEARRTAPVAGGPADAAGSTNGARPFRLLVFGGSLGAKRINAAMVEALPLLRERIPGISIVHQTGEGEHAAVAEAYARAGIAADVRPFLHDMGAQYAAADLVLCRAGASTVAELLACGRPSLLVPFPHAIYDHQTKNAQALEKEGAARRIPDADLTGLRLAEEVALLAADGERRARMAENALALGRPDAATEIARDVLALAGLVVDPPAGEGAP